MKTFPSKQEGFTLIELIVVIVILGILAATALPKFVDLSGDATQAKAQGVAGAIASGAAIQYGKVKITAGSLSLANACNVTVLQGAVDKCTPAVSGACSGSGGTGTCIVTCTDTTPSKTATVLVPCDS